MHKTRVVIQLGNSESIERRRQPFLRLVNGELSHGSEDCLRADKQAQQASQLIANTIMHFDKALAHFDKVDDYHTRKVIDYLAIDVLNDLRESMMTLASNSSPARSKSQST